MLGYIYTPADHSVADSVGYHSVINRPQSPQQVEATLALLVVGQIQFIVQVNNILIQYSYSLNIKYV